VGSKRTCGGAINISDSAECGCRLLAIIRERVALTANDLCGWRPHSKIQMGLRVPFQKRSCVRPVSAVSPSRRQIRSTRFTFTTQPASRRRAVTRRYANIRQDRYVRRAEEHRRPATTRRLRGPIRSTPSVCTTTNASRDRKRLSSGQIRAILTSERILLDEFRLKGAPLVQHC
jgi:hypothetical protein